uniref:Uncharacterized protein n=1 Tax=Amphimedon queenslandica TaxID=400682 RepID=A0A1X7TP83_AMPQE
MLNYRRKKKRRRRRRRRRGERGGPPHPRGDQDQLHLTSDQEDVAVAILLEGGRAYQDLILLQTDTDTTEEPHVAVLQLTEVKRISGGPLTHISTLIQGVWCGTVDWVTGLRMNWGLISV